MSDHNYTIVCRLRILDILYLLTKLSLIEGTIDIIISLLFTYLNLNILNNNALNLLY